MAPRVVFADIQAYLDAIADNPDDISDVGGSRHRRFWQVSYQQFITGIVPNEICNNAPIPILNKDPTQPNVDPAHCPLFQALTNPSGWCTPVGLGQMPKNGPFITDANYSVTLKNNTTISGQDIIANIRWWLTNGLPEK
jgi:hypothetical protein